MSSVFITGTGTGVGKTLVGGALSAYLRIFKGLSVGVMKPIETGEDSPSDGLILKKLSGTEDPLSEIVPYKFKKPVSPEVASFEEGRPIDVERLTSIFENLRKRHDCLIVEGAGGLLVPIKEGFFFSDLVRLWKMPVVVVSENKLGTINHTLLTCHFLDSQGIEVLGVILNEKENKPDQSASTNPHILKKYLKVPLLGVFPHISVGFSDPGFDEAIARIFKERIDVSVFGF